VEKVKQTLRQRQLEALALKQYKVGVITMGMHNFTVMATDEESAVDKVMKKGGRDAGKEGPVPVGYRIQDMSIMGPSTTLRQVIAEVLRGELSGAPEQAEPKPLITPGG